MTKRRDRLGPQQPLSFEASYLAQGNRQPKADILRALASGMKQELNDPDTRLRYAAALLDLSTHPDVPNREKPQLVAKAADKFQPLVDQDLQSVEPRRITTWLSAAVYLAYIPMYDRVAHGGKPDLGDVALVRASLLDTGAQTIDLMYDEPEDRKDAKAFRMVRGRQLRIGAHLLAARFNMRHEDMLMHARPALPREETTYGSRYPWTNWSLGLSQRGFLDNETLDRVQLLSVTTDQVYDPSVLVVSGRDDLGLRSSGEIIAASLSEIDESLPDTLRMPIAERLNGIEQSFFGLLGWRFDAASDDQT